MEEIWAVLDGTSEDAVVITLFYDVLVHQTTPEHWSQGIRTTTKISEAVLRDNDKAKCVPSSTVAFTALSMHNNQHKWPAQYQWKQQNPNYKAERKSMPRPTKKKDDKGRFMEDENGNFIIENQEFGGIFTDTMCGQSPTGGWTQAAMEKFDEYVAMDQKRRRSNPDFDDTILDLLQKANKTGKYAPEGTAGHTGSKNKKPGKSQEPSNKKPRKSYFDEEE